MPEWRNWQTRMVQVHVLARVWGFESLLRHQQFNLGEPLPHLFHHGTCHRPIFENPSSPKPTPPGNAKGAPGLAFETWDPPRKGWRKSEGQSSRRSRRAGFLQRLKEAVTPCQDIRLANLMAHAQHAALALLRRHFHALALSAAATPSSSLGLTMIAPSRSSGAAPANSLKISTPFTSVFAAQYSLATRFMPSLRQVISATSAALIDGDQLFAMPRNGRCS